MSRLLEKSFAVFALFFFAGALNSLLTPRDFVGGGLEGSSPGIRLIGFAVGIVAMALLTRQKGSLNRTLRNYWLVLVPVGFAALSSLWAVDPLLSARRSGGLVLATIFAIWAAERFSPRELINLFLISLGALCLMSYVAIFGFPHFGIHQWGDTRGDHTGSWRGMLGFKNDFGRIMAFSFCLFFATAILRRRGAVVKGTLAALSFALVVGSNSGQAMILSVVPALGFLFILMLKYLPPKERGVALVMVVPLVVLGSLAYDLVTSQVLDALGKDETLTGRTAIWLSVIESLSGNFLLGGGYGSGWAIVEADMIALRGHSVGHAHNGYLDLVVDIGVLGLLLTLCVSFSTIYSAFKTAMLNRHPEFGEISIMFCVFYYFGNIVASFVLVHNSIYWVFMVTAYCSLVNISQQKLVRKKLYAAREAYI